jgi:hypothetical protein
MRKPDLEPKRISFNIDPRILRRGTTVVLTDEQAQIVPASLTTKGDDGLTRTYKGVLAQARRQLGSQNS